MQTVGLTWREQVAIITMADPHRRNALSLSMIEGLIAALAAAGDARAVVLRAGAADRVWCAGFDIEALGPGVDPLAGDAVLPKLFRAVRGHDAPVIAMLHGSAWGGGSDLALRCDILVADPTATLAFTPARLGLPYDADGLLNVMLRAGIATALEMFATADPMTAERACQLGLFNHLVTEDQLEPFTLALAGRIARNAPLSVQSAKRHIRALAEALPLAPVVAAELQAARRRALDSEDYSTGLDAFHARVAPEFKGR